MCKDCGCGENNGIVTKVFRVPAMMCGNCKASVEGATIGLPGVMSSEVDLPEKDAVISFDPAKVDVGTITKAIEATGFEVEGVRDAEVERRPRGVEAPVGRGCQGYHGGVVDELD